MGDAQVIVLGRKHGVEDKDIQTWLEGGKNVLLLRGAELPAFSDWEWRQPEDFYGTTKVPDWPETAALSTSDFHLRAPYAMTRLKGEGVEADGMLARKEVGNGVLLATAMDPTWLRTDQQTFMRPTSWLHVRVLVSLISDLGGKLEMDEHIFRQEHLPTGQLPLTGEWQAKAIQLLPPSASPKEGHVDPGISEAARAALNEAGTETGWVSFTAPSAIEMVSEEWVEKDGEFVLRRVVEVPEAWAGKELFLELGRVDDHDVKFWKGGEGGQIGGEHRRAWSAEGRPPSHGDQGKGG